MPRAGMFHGMPGVVRLDHGSLVRRALRRLRRPGVTALLLMLAILDAFLLAPGFRYEQTGSVVANAIGSLREPAERRAGWPSRGPSVRIGWFPETDEVRVITPGDQGVGYQHNYYSSYTSSVSGLWGLTHHVRGFAWMYDVLGGSTPPTDVPARLDDVYVSHVLASGDAFAVAQMRRARRAIPGPGGNGYVEEELLWQGYLRNAASALLWAVLLLSLGWVGREGRERRPWRRLARGICPDCGYELGTLPTAAPCPECGMPHPPRIVERAPAPGASARAWARVCTPLGSGVLTTVLIVDVLSLPKGPAQTGSWVARHLPLPAWREDPGDGRRQEELGLYAFMDGGRWVFQPREVSPRPEMSQVIDLTLYHSSWSRGFWAPVWLSVHHNYGGVGWVRYSKQQLDGFGERLATFLRDSGLGQWARDIEAREAFGLSHQRMLWGGHLHNAAAIGVGMALVGSLVWIPHGIRRRRDAHLGGDNACGWCLHLFEGGESCGVCGEPK